MTEICEPEAIKPYQVTLDTDNGSHMKGAIMQATLQEMGLFYPSADLLSATIIFILNHYSEHLNIDQSITF